MSNWLDAKSVIRLGLRENLSQFSLLVVVNAFVGGMVGLERTVVPLIGSEEFKIASATIVASFIVSFGVVEGVHQSHLRATRRYVGAASGCWSWAGSFGLPVPFMIIWAPSWSWIVAANVLLGINQGLPGP